MNIKQEEQQKIKQNEAASSNEAEPDLIKLINFSFPSKKWLLGYHFSHYTSH